jgi:peptidoglycan/xylan/chitin deacetylase (PgdA/CDA1 family)
MRELILNLHGLGEPHSSVELQERRYWWTRAAFENLLAQAADRSPDADPRIVITFDDGNASDVLVALPELVRRRMTASFFVCAGRVGKQHYLDAEMIKELVGAGMSVGSHGMDHQDWRRLDAAQLDLEIGTARRQLEDLTEQRVTTVAIPFGSYDRRVLRRLNQERWKCIYTSDRGMAQSGWRMKPRETLDASMQGRDAIGELTLTPPGCRFTQTMLRLYKQWR